MIKRYIALQYTGLKWRDVEKSFLHFSKNRSQDLTAYRFHLILHACSVIRRTENFF
jgi:hypothetical protein